MRPGGDAGGRPRRIFVAAWAAKPMLDGVEAFARERGLGWEVETLPRYQPNTIALAMEKERLDGAIIGFCADEAMATLHRTSVPAVFLRYDDVVPRRRRRRLAVLHLDFTELGRAAARHFLDVGGYRAFAFVEATHDPRWSRERGDAFRDAVAKRGLPFFRFSAAEGVYQAALANRREISDIAEWLRGIPKPCGVLAATDERARDTLLACREAGLQVPRQAAILGVNNDEFLCRHIFPNLSSIPQDDAGVGRMAAETLQALFDGRAENRDIRYAVGALPVAARASTAPPSPGGMLVSRALDWIDANACGGAGVRDVVRALGVSKSLLDLRFRELGAGTVLGALTERRLREVRRRLAETDDPIEKICAASGYGDSGGLRRLFKRRHGMAMREYRLEKRRGADAGPAHGA